MVLTQIYKNAFAEVYTILNYIQEEDYSKIPEDVISVIEVNRNKEYKYEMNEDVNIATQPMLPETKAILFNFFRDYWATEEQREKIKRMQKEERQKIEEKKKIEYGTDNIFKNCNSNIKSSEGNQNLDEKISKNTSLIEVKKKNFIIKIINKIKLFFKNHF